MILFHLSSFNPLYDKQGQKSSWCLTKEVILLIFLPVVVIDKKQQLYIIRKMIHIAIRATYYIFCCRNRNWDSQDLMQFSFVFFSFFFFCFCLVLFLFLFVFFFLTIQSQAAFVNCLYVARFTIVHSKTQNNIVSIIIIISISLGLRSIYQPTAAQKGFSLQ